MHAQPWLGAEAAGQGVCKAHTRQFQGTKESVNAKWSARLISIKHFALTKLARLWIQVRNGAENYTHSILMP